MQNKNDKGRIKERPDAAARYYELKGSAMDDLVDGKGKKKSYSMEELHKYRSKKGLHLPQWLKIVLIKIWFAGAVCFFFLWGLGMYLGSVLDMLFITGIALGFVTDLLTNNVIRFVEDRPGANDAWMMFPKKRYVSLVLNVLYCFALLYCIYTAYNTINVILLAATGQTDKVILGVEPILFGVLFTGFDLLFVGIKGMFMRLIRDARAKVEGRM